jgi:G3E family GTPase
MRYKGILNILDLDRRVVLQGIHMWMGATPGAAWKPDEARETKLVFIGRNLPKDLLIDGLNRYRESRRILEWLHPERGRIPATDRPGK